MKTIGELIPVAANFLQSKGIERARRDVEELLGFVLGCTRIDLYLQFDHPLEERELEILRSLSKRRAAGEPLEYLLGSVEFFGAKIEVNSSVLIPRPETEILASKITESIDFEKKIDLWDICTGSGCLGISLKKKNPLLNVFLSDLSREALEVAKKNAKDNEVDVVFFEGDLFEPFQGQRADLIVINPPYISEAEYLTLDPSVRDFEPKTALVGGADGLDYYRRIARQAPDFLRPKGRLCLEIGFMQKEAVLALFNEACWVAKRCDQDWSGKDRFFFLEIE